MAKNWTEEDEEFIRENYLNQTYADLAKHFDVSQKAMESKIRRMGLRKQDVQQDVEMPGEVPATGEPASPPDEGPSRSTPRREGPTPIETLGSLPRTVEVEEETEEEREERLEAVREAADSERERREAAREEDDEIQRALKLLESGLDKLHDGKFGKAAADFEAIVQEPPSDTRIVDRARQYLAVTHELGSSDGFEPESADEHYLAGVMALNAGELSAALDAFETALDKAPGDDRVLYCQAAAHAKRGDPDAALEALRKAIDINESNRIYARNDSDFDALRVHEDFRKLVARREAEA